MNSKFFVFVSWVLFCGGCIETGQNAVEVPLYLAGTANKEPIQTSGGIEVLIDRADVAFGPLFLCAGAQAGHLCDSARLEWLDSAVVDTLDPESEEVGRLEGASGPVKSWMFDLGFSSQLTQSDPVVLEAARKVGGVSLVLEGRAYLEGEERPFRGQVVISQSEDTEQGVPVIRSSGSDRFDHEVTSENAKEGLTITFDPRDWVRGVDFRPAFEEEDVAVDGTWNMPDGGQALRSIRNSILAGRHPSFEWRGE